jgi:hypothetical protein
MRKVFLLLLGISLFLLSGCYNYSIGSQYGKLVEIQFFDLDNQEIEGEFINYYEMVFPEETAFVIPLGNETQKLNSPAPVELIYCAELEAETEIIVRFKIELKNNYQFYSLRINYTEYLVEEFENVETEDEYVYLDFLYQAEAEGGVVQVSEPKFKKEQRIVTGSKWVEGRTYISGFYLKIKGDESEE